MIMSGWESINVSGEKIMITVPQKMRRMRRPTSKAAYPGLIDVLPGRFPSADTAKHFDKEVRIRIRTILFHKCLLHTFLS